MFIDFDGREHHNLPIDWLNTECKQAEYVRHGRGDTYRRSVCVFYLLGQTLERYLHFPWNILNLEKSQRRIMGILRTLVLMENVLWGVLGQCRNGVRNCCRRMTLSLLERCS